MVSSYGAGAGRRRQEEAGDKGEAVEQPMREEKACRAGLAQSGQGRGTHAAAVGRGSFRCACRKERDNDRRRASEKKKRRTKEAMVCNVFFFLRCCKVCVCFFWSVSRREPFHGPEDHHLVVVKMPEKQRLSRTRAGRGEKQSAPKRSLFRAFFRLRRGSSRSSLLSFVPANGPPPLLHTRSLSASPLCCSDLVAL